ncbi:hypothetical protein B0H17DRAFT_1204899 [Mycena rosella]|uniref:Uncharacterized protein n=1 Tax=Mycena rosella TaxID=1033263 RepID=A0AAD7GDA8_MYCRO|nr:hypothetical protein B0H17DRAFT_1204899 [Mycena rosella]
MSNIRMENMGRIGPVGIEHLYRDLDTPLAVELLINRDYPELRGQHWAISWTVGGRSPSHQVQRILHIVTEIGCAHYTNWGPATRSFDPRALAAVPIAQLALAQRRVLEAIAARTEVCMPNGEWNCQDWVLAGAVEAGVLSAEERDAALHLAQS